jgi:cytochrome c oxidase assembly protein subunit 11
MPVVFFIDPALDANSDYKGVQSITLSYTFFAVQKPAKPVVAAGEGTRVR